MLFLAQDVGDHNSQRQLQKHPPSGGADDVEDACSVPRNAEPLVYVNEDATGGKRENNKLPDRG